jgi:hypothetical protein
VSGQFSDAELCGGILRELILPLPHVTSPCACVDRSNRDASDTETESRREPSTSM